MKKLIVGSALLYSLSSYMPANANPISAHDSDLIQSGRLEQVVLTQEDILSRTNEYQGEEDPLTAALIDYAIDNKYIYDVRIDVSGDNLRRFCKKFSDKEQENYFAFPLVNKLDKATDFILDESIFLHLDFKKNIFYKGGLISHHILLEYKKGLLVENYNKGKLKSSKLYTKFTL